MEIALINIFHFPIVAGSGSFGCKIAKWRSDLSSRISQFSYSHIKHLQVCMEERQRENVHENARMLSLEVESLFTDVTADVVLESLES